VALELFNLSPERVSSAESRAAWPNATLPRLLAEQAARMPEAVAVEDAERSVTFGEFLRHVQAAAEGLRQRGVRPGDVVAYQLPTSLDAVFLQYAIAFAGAVASPISLLHREHDLRHMLDLVRPSLILARPTYRDVPFAQMLEGVARDVSLPSAVLPVPDGQLGALLGGGTGGSGVRPPADPNAPLYIVWTSGTTGEPKGVIHTHNTGLCGVAAILECVEMGRGDAMLVITPVAHHIGIYAMNMLGLAGIRLVLMESWHAERAVRLIEQRRPTFTSGTPTFLIDLLRCEALAGHDVRALRCFVIGGAPVPASAVELAGEKLVHCRALAAYGTSEEGYVTSVAPDDPPALSAVSDGRPLRHMEVRVLGPDRRELSVGEEGDLVVRTPSAFVGYARRPEFTREAFDAEGWRWTGDRAILREDGTIRVAGRSKDIIIRGGVNIPVAQIESALLKHPAVGSVALVAMPDERLGEKACAYVVPSRGQELTLEELRTCLQGQQIAPTYWPERLELVDALPMTASGKVQKFRLREMIAERVRAERLQASAS
jgi:cyclohexanecarboxylate-CoA ligase